MRVVQAYDAEENNELTIAEGDELNVYRKNDESGWWLGEVVSGVNKGKKGPSTVRRSSGVVDGLPRPGWYPADFGVTL